MTDPNNIPQEAQQLKAELNAPEEDAAEDAKPELASPEFDKEYKIAKENNSGAGTQSSDPNPVSRQGADAGDKGSSTSTVDDIDSPGDSDPDDYLDMAKDITENVNAS